MVEVFTSTYDAQHHQSVYTLTRDETGRLIEEAVVVTKDASPIFDGQIFKTTYRYGAHGRLAERMRWVEKDGKRRPETVHQQRYNAQPDGMLIEDIGQQGRWEGKVTKRVWLDMQGRKQREYDINDHGNVVCKYFYAFNDHGDLVRETRPSKSGSTIITYRYVQYDAQGNWTKRVESWSQPGVAEGASLPLHATYRTFTYYDLVSATTDSKLEKPAAPQKEVQIVVPAYNGENGTEPMEKLLDALEKNPKNNLFRVTWEYSGYLHGTGTALYDRKQQTLKYWYMAQTVEYRDVERCMVRHVTPEILQQVVKEKKGTSSTTDGALFDTLFKYGCEREGCEHRHQP